MGFCGAGKIRLHNPAKCARIRSIVHMADQINPHLFRGYSIRGVADTDLHHDAVFAIGRAIGDYLCQQGNEKVLVGRDARISSPRVSRALISGLIYAGMRVMDAGMVPTPVHNFATDYYGADAGIMVTASHNPPEYNGLKIRTDRTLNSKELETIYNLARSLSPPVGLEFQDEGDSGFSEIAPIPEYQREVLAGLSLERPLMVVVDGGHGANGSVASALLRDLGCTVWEINCMPDGHFPNRSPDPTSAGATDNLAEQVIAHTADLGLAYDGDGDRVVSVDEKGRTLQGDELLMILARGALQNNPGTIVYEVSCSHAVREDVLAHGGRPFVTRTGYAFVHEAMQATKAVLGGEMSGHFFFDSPIFRFDDPNLASLRLACHLARSSKPLSALVSSLPHYYSSPVLRIDCPEAVKHEVVEEIKHVFAQSWPVDTLDGASIDFGSGWALVRASNTQPMLSVRFESETQEGLDAISNRVMSQIHKTLDLLACDDESRNARRGEDI
jgi:phosphomannomutase / phosphoglucomutase